VCAHGVGGRREQGRRRWRPDAGQVRRGGHGTAAGRCACSAGLCSPRAPAAHLRGRCLRVCRWKMLWRPRLATPTRSTRRSCPRAPTWTKLWFHCCCRGCTRSQRSGAWGELAGSGAGRGRGRARRGGVQPARPCGLPGPLPVAKQPRAPHEGQGRDGASLEVQRGRRAAAKSGSCARSGRRTRRLRCRAALRRR
jgi:hypothetical protein